MGEEQQSRELFAGADGWVRRGLPRMGDDDVVKGLVDAAETREADFDYHCGCVVVGWKNKGDGGRCDLRLEAAVSRHARLKSLELSASSLHKADPGSRRLSDGYALPV